VRGHEEILSSTMAELYLRSDRPGFSETMGTLTYSSSIRERCWRLKDMFGPPQH
jgi:hypothetical protein